MKDILLLTTAVAVIFAAIFAVNAYDKAVLPQEETEMIVEYSCASVVGAAAETEIAEIVEDRHYTYYTDIGLSFELQTVLQDICREYPDVPYELVLSVIWKESLFRNVNGDGGDSIGYMQIKEHYQKERMQRLGLTDLSIPEENFACGVDMLNDLYSKYGDWHKALICYNYGEAGAREHVFSRGLTTTKYSRAVHEYMEGLLGGWEEA